MADREREKRAGSPRGRKELREGPAPQRAEGGRPASRMLHDGTSEARRGTGDEEGSPEGGSYP